MNSTHFLDLVMNRHRAYAFIKCIQLDHVITQFMLKCGIFSPVSTINSNRVMHFSRPYLSEVVMD